MVDTTIASTTTTTHGTTVLTTPAFTSLARPNVMMAMMGITVALRAIISGATFALAFPTQLVRLSLLIATCVWDFFGGPASLD